MVNFLNLNGIANSFEPTRNFDIKEALQLEADLTQIQKELSSALSESKKATIGSAIPDKDKPVRTVGDVLAIVQKYIGGGGGGTTSPGNGGGGNEDPYILAIREENVPVVQQPTFLNFVGQAVTASLSGTTGATVTINAPTTTQFNNLSLRVTGAESDIDDLEVAVNTLQANNSGVNTGDQNIWRTIVSDAGNTSADTKTDALSILGGAGISTAITGDVLTITNDSPNIVQNAVTTVAGDTGSFSADSATSTVNFVGGSGISTAVAGNTVTIEALGGGGGLQNLWETFVADSGFATADNVTDQFTIAGGSGISTAIVGDVLTITNDAPNVSQPAILTITGNTGSLTADVPNEAVAITGGTGISTQVIGNSLVITNTSPNSTQNTFSTVNAQTGSTTANIPADTLTINGGTGISTSITGDTLTITNTAPNQNQNIFQNVTDGTNTATADTATDTLTMTGTGGIVVTVNPATDSVTIDGSAFSAANSYRTWTGDSGSSSASVPADTMAIIGAGGIVTSVTNDQIVVEYTGAAGESNNGVNLGTGAEVFAGKLGVDLNFRTLAAGAGVSVTQGENTITFANTAPDQTVVLNAGTGIGISGTYPNFTVTNNAPDQTVTLTAGTNVTIDGTYPNFTINSTGGGGSALEVQDEGVAVEVAATALNFTGAGVTVTDVGGVTTINVPGGGGGGGGSVNKYFESANLVAETPYTVTHNLGLADKDSFTINLMHEGVQVDAVVTSVDVDSLTVESIVSLTAVKITVMG